MALPIVLTAILSKLWKPLLIAALIGGAIGTAYLVGYSRGSVKCELNIAKKTIDELYKSEREVEKLRGEFQKRRDDIENSLSNKPINDTRDSCLLSGDPFSSNCLGEDK